MQMTGNAEGLWTEVQQLAAIPHLDKVTRGLAHAWHLLLCACRGGNITEARVAVEDLATRAGEATLRHFEHVALHNAATAALAQADYVSAYEHARQASATLVPAASSQRDTSSSSTLMTQAVAACELGRVGDGIALVKLALGDSSAPSDALADACYLSAVTGDFERAAALEHQLSGVLNRGPAMFGAVAQASHARIARLLTLGDFERAHLLAVGLSGSCEEVDSAARDSYLLALTSVLLETPDAAERVAEALAACRTQEAWRWQLRAEIVASVQGADTEAIRQAVTQAATSSHLALLETADTVGTALHLLEPVPKQVRESIAHYPGRWRPVLTRQINSPRTPAADTAARLLSEFGSLEDAPIIAEYERQSAVGRRTLSLSRGLLKRVSPTLRIHDLGRTVFEVAGRQLLPSDTRRKAASLPVFLITRPRQTATREQLMEALWPDQDPCAATNSLHQTLHYVRRAIAPWRQTGLGADYIAMDAEVVFLDPELVQVDSVAFMRQATEVLSAGSAARRGAGLMRLYVGGFAPEYEYEEWTLDWRNLVHTTFLHLAHRTAVLLMEHLRPSEAVEVLSHAVSVDGQALELHALLVRALDLTGAKDAARQQYRFYATAVRRELGIEPPPMGELLEGGEDPVD
jgi:DNA-binding SARP family transcriptional activator